MTCSTTVVLRDATSVAFGAGGALAHDVGIMPDMYALQRQMLQPKPAAPRLGTESVRQADTLVLMLGTCEDPGGRA